MNAPLPIVSANAAVPTAQNQTDRLAAVEAEPLPEGGFQGLLEQRLQSASAEPAREEALEGTSTEPVVDTAAMPQALDSTRLPADTLATFFAAQGPATQPAIEAQSGAAREAIDLGLARDLAVEWRMFARPEARFDTAGAELDQDSSARMMAAMSADYGKLLPSLGRDASAAIAAAVADTAALAAATVDELPALRVGTEVTPASTQASFSINAAPSTSSPAETRAVNTQVTVPFARAEWGEALGERVTWLVGQRLQVADIQVNPPQLGPIELRISIQNDQASLFFSSSHAAVREAIQAALPRLGDLLAQSGLALGHTSVGAESFSGQQQAFRQAGGHGFDPDQDRSGGDVVGAPSLDGVTERGLALLRGRGGVDMFV